MVCHYVDDLIYTGLSKDMVVEFKTSMMKEFKMSDPGLMRYFLGIQVNQFPGKILISQEKYVRDLLKKFNMSECKPIASLMTANEKLLQDDGAPKIDSKYFRSLVGSLIYLINSRLDILYFVSIISRFMENPNKLHLVATKRILRYLQGTKNHGILYKQQDENRLIGYSDSDWAGSYDDTKSTSGYVFCLGTNIISWCSREQSSIALSSAKAEYIAANKAVYQSVWLRRILCDLQQNILDPTTILCDNMLAIAMTKNPIFHARSKHVELRHHFIREMVSKKEIQPEFINTYDQPADVLTKAVPTEKFQQFKKFLKITN